MSKDSTTSFTEMQQLASFGGKVAAMKMTAEQKAARAKAGGLAAARKGLPTASHVGELKIGDITIPCAVVDGKRLISQRGMFSAFNKGGMKRQGRVADEIKHLEEAARRKLEPFIRYKSLIPFITSDLIEKSAPTKFIHPSNNTITYGYDCQVLVDVCDLFLGARAAGALPVNQIIIAQRAETLMRGFAKVGLTALIDECTSYQEVRQRGELEAILSKYIAEEMRPWTKTFPTEFFKQVYKLYQWEWGQFEKNHPSVVGKFINRYIYGKMPKGILEQLQESNPILEAGYRANRHHQFLSEDTGAKHLEKQISKVITVMQLATDKAHFEQMIDRLFPCNQMILDI